jgi:outer membrane protein assembly factor BamB
MNRKVDTRLLAARMMFFGLAFLAADWLRGDDWPQWMGPNRDNRWTESGVLTEFSNGGPKVLWRSPVAGGYAGPAVAQGKVFITDLVTQGDVKTSNFERQASPGKERVLCLDVESGDQLWKYEYPVEYSISYPAGPRCTPVVEEERVYTLGAEGHLACLNVNSGAVIWERDLKSDYNTQSALWGYAGHPLLDGDKLLCIVGGQGSHAVAFDKRTGNELWRYGSAPEQGYSPPKIITAAGVRQLILMSPAKLAAVDPETGSELWTADYEATSGSIIMTPVQVDEYLYVGGYSNRNLLLKLAQDKPGATTVFRDKSKVGISPVNVQPFQDGNILYGMNQDGAMMAVELPGGKRLWETGQPLADRPVQTGTAFIVKNQEHFYLFAETGELIIAEISPDGFKEIDRAKLIEPTNNAFGRAVVWSAPAFANGCVFVRNDEECVCVSLRGE